MGRADRRSVAAAGSVPVPLLAYLIALADVPPSSPVDDPFDPLEQPPEHDGHGTRNRRALLHEVVVKIPRRKTSCKIEITCSSLAYGIGPIDVVSGDRADPAVAIHSGYAGR
jgi:hypothetical protein